ncbi:elongator complex protein 4 [Nematocida minor]|uniref:elongator complex protein 4 n=1 Tax=Nematocida minor TaxID=1912983 RepID=UPI002220C18C|nr:elongator complex protein 4 [Nematocida minor]KAI5189663.1 elongator complex protein 4 [Nematocida minor]
MFKRHIKEEKEKKSTGIEEMDSLLGGGIRNGEILLLVQQENVKYHLGVHRVFIAQGLEDDEVTVHSSLDNPILSVPGRQMQKAEEAQSSAEKIAWRYKTMSRTVNTVNISTGSLSTAKKYNFKSRHPKENEVKNILDKSLSEISEYLDSTATSNTRISLSSLFSPLWQASEQEINDFLFHLRKTVRKSRAVCMVSIPVYLLDGFNYGYFDSIINLEANTVKELKYDGLIQCIKTEVNDLHKYALVCQSTGIKIEKIVLPPE